MTKSEPTITAADITTGLSPDPKNANRGTTRGRKMLSKSVKELGAARSIVVDKHGVVVAGNKTREAAQAAGLKDAIVVETEGDQLVVVKRRDWDLSVPGGAAQRYAIADNRIAEVDLDFDTDVLKAAMDDGINLEEFWSKAELRGLLGGEAIGVREGDDDLVDRVANPITVEGDLWLLGDHRLLCASSTLADSYKQACGSLKPFMMVSDPPYGVELDTAWRTEAGVNKQVKRREIQGDNRIDWRDAYVLFRGDVAYLWHEYQQPVPADLATCGLLQRTQIVWVKRQLVFSRGHYHSRHEVCVYAVRKNKRSRWCGDSKQDTVWEMSSPGRRGSEEDETNHGSQKPLDAMLRPIINHGEIGDVVYDPFVGSGTTLIAAERAGRKCVAIDIDPGYVDAVVERWQKATGKPAQRAPGSPGLAGKAQE